MTCRFDQRESVRLGELKLGESESHNEQTKCSECKAERMKGKGDLVAGGNRRDAARWSEATNIIIMNGVFFMDEKEIIRKCNARRWKYNAVSAYILETDMTPYQLAKIMGVSRAAVHYWITDDSLSQAVRFAFLSFRKIFQMYGVTLAGLF